MRNVSAIASVCCAAAAVLLTACSGNGLTGPTNSSTSSSFTAEGGTARLSLNHYNDPTAVGIGGNPDITCPSEAPRIFHSGVLGKRLELQWQPVYNVHRYQVEVEYFTPGNNWVPFAFRTYVDEVLAEITGGPFGRYRLRVRSVTTCGDGSWSDWLYESIDSADAPPPFIPGPPVSETTLTYWVRSTGSDQAAESGCENPGGGQTGTYLGDGVCQINTPPGESVNPPQAGQWEGPYDSPPQ